MMLGSNQYGKPVPVTARVEDGNNPIRASAVGFGVGPNRIAEAEI